MILSPQPRVSTPPSLADVLEAAKDGSGLIGRLEIIDATPTTAVPEDVAETTHEELVEEAIETLTSAAELQAAYVGDDSDAEEDPRAAEVRKNLDDVLPKLLAEIADLERCVRRANEEAERAANHLEQARGLVAKVVAAAETAPRNSVLRLAVPGQRASAADQRPAPGTDDRGNNPRRGRW